MINYSGLWLINENVKIRPSVRNYPGCPKLPRLTVQTHTIIHIKNNNRSEQEDVNILSFELNGHIILKKADCFTLISTLKKASRYCWESPASVLRSKTWSKRFCPNYKQITVGSDQKRLISTGYRWIWVDPDWVRVGAGGCGWILTGCGWVRLDAGGCGWMRVGAGGSLF